MIIKGEDWLLARGKEEVKGVWKSRFERVMNEKIERKIIMSSMGVEAGGKHVKVQKGNDRKEVKKAETNLNIVMLQVWIE